MPTITAERVYLAPISRDTAQALLDGRRPQAIRFAEKYPSPFSLEMMATVVHHAEPGPGSAYFVVRRCDDAVIGEIGCAIDKDGRGGQVGYSLVEPVWGQGYATEALSALLRHLLVELGLRHVCADTLVGHVASRRVMEKAGMTLVGERDEVDDGIPVRLVRYELNASGEPTLLSAGTAPE